MYTFICGNGFFVKETIATGNRAAAPRRLHHGMRHAN
jgi:hypothetical protein